MIRKLTAFLVVFSFSVQQCFAGPVITPNASAVLPGAVLDSFRPASFCSLLLSSENEGFDLLLDKGDAVRASASELRQITGKLMEYFLVGVSLPDKTFWVNLRPDKADEIIDPALEKTDLGRVLLEADVQLKKDLSLATSPNSAAGRKYWSKLYAKAEALFGKSEISIPTLSRPWIVPGEIIVRQSSGGIYIYKAGLNVMLEQDFLKDSSGYNFDDPRLKELNQYSARLIKELILPSLIKKVNSDRSYASLRQVYHSLILAQWFKKHFRNTGVEYAARIDSGNLEGLTAKDAWSKNAYYDAYRSSFENGEYNVSERVTTSETALRRYTSGGIEMMATLNQGPALTTVEASVATLPAELPQGVVGVDSAVARDGGNKKISLDQLEQLIKELDLQRPDQIHIKGLVRKYNAGAVNLKIGENIIPTTLLTLQQLSRWLVDFELEIQGDPANAGRADDVVLVANAMEGGLGSSVGRDRYLALKDPSRVADGKVKLGAKATDLFLTVKGVTGKDANGNEVKRTVELSIAEIKLLRIILVASQYGAVIFQPLVNTDSLPSYEKLLNSICLTDRLDESRPADQKRTYLQLMKESGVEMFSGDKAMLLQMNLPSIDLTTGQLTRDHTAPGGHGQWGVTLLDEAYQFQQPEGDTRDWIRVFYNGDGTNNFGLTSIAKWMKRNRVPVVMVTTTKTGIDKKGGMLGLQDGQRPQIVELAQAKKAGQEKLFYSLGLNEPGTPVTIDGKTYVDRGEQTFNTNVALINQTILGPVLRDLAALTDVEFEGEMLSGEEVVTRIISPDLIENVKKDRYVQLEGAIASSLLNLNAFFATSKDARVAEILKKHNIDTILKIVNVSEARRTEVFTPVKFSFDFWLQAFSDRFEMDPATWTLRDTDKAKAQNLKLPTFDLDPDHYPFYKDVQNCIDAFGNASTTELDFLHIRGEVLLPGAVLKGEVIIDSAYAGRYDLTTPEARRQLGVPLEGPLVLENRKIVIEADGTLRDGGARRTDSVQKLDNTKGGIAFQALPILDLTGIPLAPASGKAFTAAELDAQWRQIRLDTVKGDVPCLLMKQYILGARNDPGRMKDIATCVSNILKSQEAEGVSTSPELQEVVAYLG